MSKREDLDKLTQEELLIYNSVMRFFPATSHESALNVALQGGVKWDYIPK